MKLLLIDQDTHILEMLQTSLTKAGYIVFVAADGNAGLRLARSQQPDLIVLDLLLPGMDGLEFCRQLEADPDTHDIPYFLITSIDIPDDRTFWVDSSAGAPVTLHPIGWQTKPLDLNQFMRQVKTNLFPQQPHELDGPEIFLIIADDTLRFETKQDLMVAGFKVVAHSRLIKPVSAMRIPAVMVIDEEYITPTVQKDLTDFQQRSPAFALIVLCKNPPDSKPAYLSKLDTVLVYPLNSWQISLCVQKSVGFHTHKVRTDFLSKQLLALNQELVSSQQTLLAQNTELNLVNRRMRQMSDLQETLTSMLVHDLKAPLSAMQGALQFMTMDPRNTISDGSKHIITGGLAAGQQMQRMTATLLDEQKLENDQLVFDIEPVSLQDTLDTCLTMMSPLFNMYEVTVDIQLPPELPYLHADPIILQRILENLLDNAVKYSPANEIITVDAKQHNNAAVQISIADKGDGIPTEFRETIFEQFTQLENAKLQRRWGGTGLGLTFCKLAVESMGGRIWVDSPNDAGSVFRFTIPVAPNGNEAEAAS